MEKLNFADVKLTWFDVFTASLTAVFVGAKLTGVIAWSWWWVLSPAWVPLAAAGIVMVIALIWAAIATAVNRG